MLQKIEEHIEDGNSRCELRDDLDLALVARMVDGAMRELMSNPARDLNVTINHITDAYASWPFLPK